IGRTTSSSGRTPSPRPSGSSPGRTAPRGRSSSTCARSPSAGDGQLAGGSHTSRARFELGQADDAPPGAPPPGRPVEAARTSGTTAAAAAVIRQPVGPQLVPVALDEPQPARVTPRAAALAVVHVSGVGVPDTVASRDGAGAG